MLGRGLAAQSRYRDVTATTLSASNMTVHNIAPTLILELTRRKQPTTFLDFQSRADQQVSAAFFCDANVAWELVETDPSGDADVGEVMHRCVCTNKAFARSGCHTRLAYRRLRSVFAP